MESSVNLSLENVFTADDRAKTISEVTLLESYFTVPVKVIFVNTDSMIVDVKPLVLGVTTDGEKIDSSIVYNVKYIRIQSGNSAIIIDPTPGDIGVVFVADEDISAVKRTKDYAMPLSNRKHSLSDSIYFGGLLNKKPAQYVKFTSDGIEIYSPTQITLSAPEINANCNSLTATVENKTTLTSNKIDINASSEINLSAPVISLNGALTSNPLNGSGEATINIPLNSTKSITASGISLTEHTHGSVQSGNSNTGKPK